MKDNETVPSAAPAALTLADAAAHIERKAEDFARDFGYSDMGSLSFGQGDHAQAKMDYYTSMTELADELCRLAAQPAAADSEALQYEYELGVKHGRQQCKCATVEGNGDKHQQALMRFDPATCQPQPYPSHAKQYRTWHGTVAWIYNPWTGKHRDPRDIGSDANGFAIVSPEEAIEAAMLAAAEAPNKDQSHD